MSSQANPQADWDNLYEVAVGQGGFFTTQQAADVGYSPQLLAHHKKAGRIRGIRRGVYRLVHFPAEENEELIVSWLWSECAGVFSHQTALSLHSLSDVLPSQVHLSLPNSWSARRLRAPENLVLHYDDVPKEERTWFGIVPITTPARTLNDCARTSLSPELLQQATLEAIQRGLVAKDQLAEVELALHPFGGITE